LPSCGAWKAKFQPFVSVKSPPQTSGSKVAGKLPFAARPWKKPTLSLKTLT
jgi:hypothetical protein